MPLLWVFVLYITTYDNRIYLPCWMYIDKLSVEGTGETLDKEGFSFWFWCGLCLFLKWKVLRNWWHLGMASCPSISTLCGSSSNPQGSFKNSTIAKPCATQWLMLLPAPRDWLAALGPGKQLHHVILFSSTNIGCSLCLFLYSYPWPIGENTYS